MEGEVIDPKSVFPLGLQIRYQHHTGNRQRNEPAARYLTLVSIEHKARKSDGELTAVLTWETYCMYPGCNEQFQVVTGSCPANLNQARVYCNTHYRGEDWNNDRSSFAKKENTEYANEKCGECKAAQEPNPE